MNIFHSDILWHVEFRGHDGFAPQKENALQKLEAYVDDMAFIFVKMFNIYKYGKKPYSTYFVEVLVSGKDQLYDKTTDLSFEDRTQLVKHGIESGKIPKDFQNDIGENLLMLAKEDFSMVQFLLEQKFDPNTITFYHEGTTTRGKNIPLSLLLYISGLSRLHSDRAAA